MRLRAHSLLGGYMIGVYGLVAAISVVSIRVFTELAPPAVFGEANLLLTFLGLAVTMSSQPFTNTQIRYHSAAQAEGRGDAFTRESLLWTCAAGAGVCGLAVIAWTGLRLMHATHLGWLGVLGMIGIVFATAGRNVFYIRIQAERQNTRYGALLVVEALAGAGGTALALWVSASVDGYVVGQAGGMICAMLVGFGLTPRANVRMLMQRGRTPHFLQQVKAYGLPFAPMGILSWFANLADRYVLGATMGVKAVGLYIAPFSIASRGMSLLGGALNDLFRPVLFEAANRNDHQRSRLIFWTWLGARVVAAIGGVIALAVLGPLLARVMLAPAYRKGAVPIMMWIAAAYGVQGIIQTLENRLMSLNRTSWMIWTLAIGGAANLIFSLLLIPRFGAIGAGEATTASFVVQAGVTVFMLMMATRRPA